MVRASLAIAVVLAGCGTAEGSGTEETVAETETVAVAEVPVAEVPVAEVPGAEIPSPPAVDPGPASCEDGVRVRRAAEIALDAARADGLDPALLAGCDAVEARCGPVDTSADPEGPVDAPPPARCTVAVSVITGVYRVRVTPAARDRAPIGIEAWIDAQVSTPPGRLEIAATRWAVSRDGAIAIAGVPRQVSHTHGGPPARIGGATVRITNRRDVPVPLAVTRVEWLGPGPEREVAATSIRPEVLPPGATTEVHVLFEAQPAYMSWHSRFASRVTFRAGDEELVATVEHYVLRREPIRR